MKGEYTTCNECKRDIFLRVEENVRNVKNKIKMFEISILFSIYFMILGYFFRKKI